MELRFSEEIVRAFGENKIGGVASVFYNPGDKGTEFNLYDNVFERIHPSAFDDVLRGDTVALFNHDKNYPLGRTPSTLRLWTDAKGLNYEIDLDMENPNHRSLYRSIQRGDVRGSSFHAYPGFTKWSKDGDKEVRTIMRMKRLADVSPVVTPAYGSSTATLRSCGSSEIEAILREQKTFHEQLQTQMRIEKARQMLGEMNT